MRGCDAVGPALERERSGGGATPDRQLAGPERGRFEDPGLPNSAGDARVGPPRGPSHGGGFRGPFFCACPRGDRRRASRRGQNRRGGVARPTGTEQRGGHGRQGGAKGQNGKQRARRHGGKGGREKETGRRIEICASQVLNRTRCIPRGLLPGYGVHPPRWAVNAPGGPVPTFLLCTFYEGRDRCRAAGNGRRSDE